MYCSKCGTQNQNENLFCFKCGNRLNNPYQTLNYNQGSGINTNMVQNTIPPQVPISNNQGSGINTNMVQNTIPPQVPISNNQGSIMNTNKKKNKKTFIFIGVGLVIVALIILSVFLFSKNSSSSIDKRTIMIYMIGSDLESDGGMATLDIEEIESSGVSLKDNNIIVYAGGAMDWHNNFNNNSIYELTSSGFELVESDNKSSMGEAQTLTEFLDYVYNNYKSDSYGLILWDHGAGPIIGYGSDENYDGDGLFLYELKNALENSEFNEENKLEFIGFDACLMASAEVASILSEYSNYMIASQDLEPGYGWDYAFLSDVNKNTDTIDLGKLIIDYTDNYYKDLSEKFGGTYTFYITLSLLDLSKIDGLEENLNDLFVDVDVALANNGYSKIVSKITRAKSFGYAGYNQSYDLVDLTGISEQLSEDYKDKALDLKESIDDVVVYQKTNVEGANGISVYYPYYTKSLLTKFLEIYETLDFAEEYTEFLNNYSKILSGERLANFSLKSVMPELSLDEEEISVNLDSQVVANYNSSNYIIFRDMKNGYYMPVYRSSDVTLNNTTLVANFDKKQLSVIVEEGESGWVTMIEYERNNSYTIYNIPIMMHKTGDSFEDFDVDNAYIQLRVDKNHPNGTIVNVIPMSDVNDPSSIKKIINLKDWDYIQFFNSEYKLYDDAGVYTGNWESSGTYYLAEVSTEENYKLEFVELDKDYDYYCLFQVDDTQGNRHYTNLVKID